MYNMPVLWIRCYYGERDVDRDKYIYWKRDGKCIWKKKTKIILSRCGEEDAAGPSSHPWLADDIDWSSVRRIGQNTIIFSLSLNVKKKFLKKIQ